MEEGEVSTMNGNFKAELEQIKALGFKNETMIGCHLSNFGDNSLCNKQCRNYESCLEIDLWRSEGYERKG